MKTSRKYLIALTAALGLVPVVLDSTIVTVALSAIGKSLNTDLNTTQWIVTGYLLANAATIVPAGYIGSRLGMKQTFLVGLSLFTLMSLLCGIAPDGAWLVVFRVLQGIAGGILMPVAQATAMQPFNSTERPKALAVVSIPIMLAPIFGPTLGGWLIDIWSWHSIFLINIPVGIAVVIMAWKILPATPVEQNNKGGFDFAGLVLSMLGVTTVIYGINLVTETNPTTITAQNPQGDIYGWGYWLVWTLFGTGMALLVTFSLYELRRTQDPLVDLRQFKRYDFTMSNLMNWLQGIVVVGVIVLLPVFLQQIHLPNLSPVEAGLTLMPMSIATLIGMVLAGVLYHKIGVRAMVVFGFGSVAIGAWQLSNLTATGSTGWMLPWLVCIGFGGPLIGLPVQNLALASFTGGALAKAASLFTSTRMIFSSIGITVLTTILIQQTRFHAEGLRDQVLGGLPAGTPADPANLLFREALAKLASQAGTNAMSDVFRVLAMCAAVLVVVALALPSRKAIKAKNAAIEAEKSPELAGV
jgi:EmrB/QacA subfamily drug resistance transporter